MARMIIKKEDIKDDIEITFEDNVVFDSETKEPYINFVNGKLSVRIVNKTIVDNFILDSVKLKKEYLDKFLIEL